MGGWMNGWVDKFVDEWVNEWMDICTSGLMNRRIDGWVDGG